MFISIPAELNPEYLLSIDCLFICFFALPSVETQSNTSRSLWQRFGGWKSAATLPLSEVHVRRFWVQCNHCTFGNDFYTYNQIENAVWPNDVIMTTHVSFLNIINVNVLFRLVIMFGWIDNQLKITYLRHSIKCYNQ